jgi:hypothetical protein
LDALFSKKKKLGLNGVKVIVEFGLAGASEEIRLSNKLIVKIVKKASYYKLSVFARLARVADLQDTVNDALAVIVNTMNISY